MPLIDFAQSIIKDAQTLRAHIWGIFDDHSKPLIKPDNFVEFAPSDKSKISTFPIEKGGFADYNKVAEPITVKMIISKGGTVDDRATFLASLRTMKESVALVNLVTPEKTYKSMNLETFDYSRTAPKGAALIVAALHFVEVRQVTPQYATATLPAPKVKAKGAASAKDTGKQQPKPLSPGMQALIDERKRRQIVHSGGGL